MPKPVRKKEKEETYIRPPWKISRVYMIPAIRLTGNYLSATRARFKTLPAALDVALTAENDPVLS